MLSLYHYECLVSNLEPILHFLLCLFFSVFFETALTSVKMQTDIYHKRTNMSHLLITEIVYGQKNQEEQWGIVFRHVSTGKRGNKIQEIINTKTIS